MTGRGGSFPALNFCEEQVSVLQSLLNPSRCECQMRVMIWRGLLAMGIPAGTSKEIVDSLLIFEAFPILVILKLL